MIFRAFDYDSVQDVQAFNSCSRVYSFSAITTKTSFRDHLFVSVLEGGLMTALSALAKR